MFLVCAFRQFYRNAIDTMGKRDPKVIKFYFYELEEHYINFKENKNYKL